MPNTKNEYIVNFIRQITTEKLGQTVTSEVINKEIDRLYDKFSTDIASFFKQFISTEDQKKLDILIDQNGDGYTVLSFFMKSIDNFEGKIIEFLINFKNSYLNS